MAMKNKENEEKKELCTDNVLPLYDRSLPLGLSYDASGCDWSGIFSSVS